MPNGWHRKNHNTPAEQARRKQYQSREHRAQHARDKRLVQAGNATCWRCRRWIPPGSDWHSGHDDHDRRIYRGPEHARCNLGAAAVKGAAIRNRARGRRRTRTW